MGYYSSKLFYNREYKFKPIAAPDNFDRTAQPVDIFEKFKMLHLSDSTAVVIGYWPGTTQHYFPELTNFSWRYGETINGTEVISQKITSGTFFTNGSTKRWVCVYYDNAPTIFSYDLIRANFGSMTWVYASSPYLRSVVPGYSNSSIRYIHIGECSQTWETLGGFSFYDNINLTGTLHLPSEMYLIENYGLNWVPNITKVNIYRSYPPTIYSDSINLAGNPVPLHVPVGSSGYNVAPWTDTAIFSQIIADL